MSHNTDPGFITRDVFKCLLRVTIEGRREEKQLFCNLNLLNTEDTLLVLLL